METKDLRSASMKHIDVKKIDDYAVKSFADVLSIEEPLEITLIYGPADARIKKNNSVTMRTPGNDPELAAGFLFTEGIISSYQQIKEIKHTGLHCNELPPGTYYYVVQIDTKKLTGWVELIN